MTYARRTTNRSLYKPKNPKSSGTSGEIAMFQLLTSAGIKFKSGMAEGGGVRIQTKFNIYPFSCDFLLIDKPVVIEVDGGLHRKTWHGRPAVHRMKKDAVKDECLRAEGYMVLRFIDTEIKKPENHTRILDTIRNALGESK